jgi:hypothetical protein
VGSRGARAGYEGDDDGQQRECEDFNYLNIQRDEPMALVSASFLIDAGIRLMCVVRSCVAAGRNSLVWAAAVGPVE